MDPRPIKLAVRVVGLGFILALVLGVVSMFGGGHALGAATTITIISGDIQVRHGSGSFAAANDGDVLTAGDTVRTGDGARAVLTYFEGSTVSLEPNTELAIEDASTLTDGSTIIVMQQNLGRTWHVVTKLVTGGSKYEVRTPASTASVRGTTFTVDVGVEDALPIATVTTTEGTVVHSAPDPQAPSRRVSVPVTAGTAEKIKKGQTPAPAAPAPEPEHKATVEVGAGNALVVDPLGRSNGFTRDGKRVIQTPGATVKKDGDRVIVVLPDLPEGKLAARVDEGKRDERSDNGNSADIKVQTTVEQRGKAPVKIEESVKASAPKQDDKKTGDAPRVADKVDPKAPRLVPNLPATPKRVELVVPKSADNKNNGSKGVQTDRDAAVRPNGTDSKSKDKAK
jgi:hypothetical protein